MTGITVQKGSLTAKVDFSQVKEQSGIRPKHVPEGEYIATIKSVESKPAKDGTDMWLFIIGSDAIPGASYPYYVKLTIEQAWKLRALIVACGLKAPKTAIAVNATKLVGKTLGIVLEDDEYQGKMKSVIAQVIPAVEVSSSTAPIAADDDDEDEDEDLAPAPAPKARTKKAAPAPVIEDEDEDEELDLDEL